MECNPLPPKPFCHFPVSISFSKFIFMLAASQYKDKHHCGICFTGFKRSPLKSCIAACNRIIAGTGFNSAIIYKDTQY